MGARGWTRRWLLLLAAGVTLAAVLLFVPRTDESRFASLPPGAIATPNAPGYKLLLTRLEKGTLDAWRKIRNGRGSVSKCDSGRSDYYNWQERYRYDVDFCGDKFKVHVKLESRSTKPDLSVRLRTARNWLARRGKPVPMNAACRAGGPYRPLDAEAASDGHKLIEYRRGEPGAIEWNSTSGEGPGVIECFYGPACMLGKGVCPLPHPGARYMRRRECVSGETRVVGEEKVSGRDCIVVEQRCVTAQSSEKRSGASRHPELVEGWTAGRAANHAHRV